MKFNLKLTAFLAIALSLISSSGWAATYYVRTADGGTSTECTGLADAAYDGSGSGEACAFNHIFYVRGWCGDTNNDCTSGPFVGGDTLVIKDESVVGYTSGFAGCSTGYPYGCLMRPIPSGTAANPTKIYGANHASCADDFSNTTKVWGRERAEWIFNLAGNDYITFKCLEITDKASCIGNLSTQATDGSNSIVCKRSAYPMGNHADNGIISFTGTASNIVLDHVNIHGLGKGVFATKKRDWTLNHVKINFNHNVGWDNDLEGDGATTGNHDEGNINWNNVEMQFNGCGEVWDSPGTPFYCASQQQGGYGDSQSTGGGNNASYTFIDVVFMHNVSDDIDNLYDTGTSTTMKVLRGKFQGSAGQAIKSAAKTTYTENVVGSYNCGYFEGKSFTAYDPAQSGRSGSSCDNDGFCDTNENSTGCFWNDQHYSIGDPRRNNATVDPGEGDCAQFDSCRAQSLLSFANKVGGQKWYNKNSTFYSNGDTIMTMSGGGCDDNTLYDSRNTVFIGGNQHTSGPGISDSFYSDGSGACEDVAFVEAGKVTGDYNLFINTKDGSSDIDGQDHSIYLASDVSRFVGPIPLDDDYLTGDDVLDNFKLVAATNDGRTSVTCQGDCSIDVNGFPRGSQWDIGGFEYDSEPTSFCGDGIINGSEQCDGLALNGQSCTSNGYDEGTLGCTSGCVYDFSGCNDFCGNGTIESPEECDGSNLNSNTCVTEGFESGTISCNGCQLNTSACFTDPCGNGTIQSPEECDGTNLNGNTCQTEGFTYGTATCLVDCTLNTSGCSNPSCGNGIVESGEQCDGAALNSKTCTTQGFDSGTLACNGNCTFNTSSCAFNCGNGTIQAPEACDGSNLNSKTCVTQGFDSGTLACNSTCTLNTSGCVNNFCGDGAIGDAESCDGSELNNQTCVTQGFTSGTLTCRSNCTFNTSACVTVLPAVCGNGVIEGNEVCDGAALNSQTCVTQGFVSGSLSCSSNCAFNTSLCSNAVCGNGIIDSGESCDGAALNSATCVTQGFDSGTLTCANNCTFNTSACAYTQNTNSKMIIGGAITAGGVGSIQ